MTTLMIPTGTPERRWTVVDIVDNTYLHVVRFLYGAWVSPYVWLIFGLFALAQPAESFWMVWIRNVALVVFVANFGRLWQRQETMRKNQAKGASS